MDGPINLNELKLAEIRPNDTSIETTLGGCKLVIIGKPGSGKSTLIKALLSSKRCMIPCAVIISGSEEANNFYKGIIPSLFIYQKFTPQIIARIKARQMKAKAQLGQRDSWLLLVIDDCMDNAKLFHDSSVVDLFKNGRHWNVLVIVANQYCMDMLPSLRSSIDGVFIFRENNVNYKDKLYNNFASVVPSKKLFYNVMDQVTLDYTCMYIDNSRSHENWTDAVRWYKAPLTTDDIIPFGCKTYWDYAVKLGENMPNYFNDLKNVPTTLPLSNENVSILPLAKENVSILHFAKENVPTTLPLSKENVSILPSSKENVSILPSSKENVSILPSSKENVSILPSSKENVSTTLPSSKENVSTTLPLSLKEPAYDVLESVNLDLVEI